MVTSSSVPPPLSVLLGVCWDPEANVGGVPLRWRQLQHTLAQVGPLYTFVAAESCEHGQFDHPPVYLQDQDGQFRDPYHSQYCPDAQNTLNQLTHSHHFDVMIFSGLWMAPYMLRLPANNTSALVLDTHNLQSDLERQIARSMGPNAPEWLTPQYLDGIERLERLAMTAASSIWVCSQLDLQETRRLHPDTASRLVIVPNAVPVPGRLPPPVPITKITFIGRLDYGPNRMAAQFIIDQLHPALDGLAAQLQCIIAGAWPIQDLADAATSSPILLVEDPDDVEPLRRGSISIVPLFEGSGTRMKVLEAMAAGSPIVSTAKGVEGVGAVPGEHYLQAETASQFNHAINQLMNDPQLRSQVVTNAHHLVKKRYSYEVAVTTVRSALADHRLRRR